MTDSKFYLTYTTKTNKIFHFFCQEMADFQKELKRLTKKQYPYTITRWAGQDMTSDYRQKFLKTQILFF